MIDQTVSSVLDQRQLHRIEAVHRGFLYQHLYTTACLLLAPNSGVSSILVERDEDVEIVYPNKRIYIQVKTRSSPLTYGDIEGAIERFDMLRAQHETGERPGYASFVVSSNIQPGEALLQRMDQSNWPNDLQIHWPDGSTEFDSALPMPWCNISDAHEKCTELAATLPYGMLAPETLVWKLAALAMLAATGNPPNKAHAFNMDDLPNIFEQMVVQLQDFPDPPVVYRSQTDEPPLITSDRVRIITGYSGAGKTAWVSQAALHTTSLIAYFDVKDMPGSALASALARELAARYFGKTGDRLGEVLLPGASGTEILHAISARFAADGEDVTIVLDNAHCVPPQDLFAVTQQNDSLKFILISQPGRNVSELEALLSITSRPLRGWATDTIALEVASRGCRGDFATCHLLSELTAGLPFYVQNAISITAREYDGSLAHFCADLEAQKHTVETAQEIILTHVFNDLPAAIRDSSGVLSLSDIPLERYEASRLLTNVLGLDDKGVASILRYLRSCGLMETFGGNRFKIHDAMRLLGQSHLETLGKDVVRKAQGTLTNIVFDSLQQQWEMPKFSLLLRMLAANSEIKTLVELATDELFHELGVNPEIMAFLDKAASCEGTEPGHRFWALDALVFADLKNGNIQLASQRIKTMANLITRYVLGVDERLALLMKRMNMLAVEGKPSEVEAVLSDISELIPDNPVHQRIFRYNAALALYHLGRKEMAINETFALIQEYYDLLGITPADIFAKNPDEIWLLLKKDQIIKDNLKHLADSLDLYATAMNSVARDAQLSRIHAVKFYQMAGAPDSLIRVGQDLVDEFIGRKDFIGARQVIESNLLPNVFQLKMLARIIPVRSQYAVVLAYCGDFESADAEMARLEPYEVGLDERGQQELRNQRKKIAEMREQCPPKQWIPSSSVVNLLRNVKVGRNEPCPCGSGKKLKKCHGDIS